MKIKNMIMSLLVAMMVLFAATYAMAHCGACGIGGVEEKHGVKEITYAEFQKIRSSGEDYVLLDALSTESYNEGHIEGALSLPVNSINAESAGKLLNKTDNIVVYCGSFKCSASTNAARVLQALGYENVLDYKGGLQEWEEKGNSLVK